MEKCPKCGFHVPDGATECPACGIVLAKYRPSSAGSPRPQRPADQPSPQPAPRSEVEPSPWPAAQPPPAPPITAGTLAALHAARPWIRFVVGYGFVASALLLLVGAGLLIAAFAHAEMLFMAVFYLLYGGLGFALALPLRRSVEPLRQVHSLGPSTALEQFAVHHSVFWRRTGVMMVVVLGLIVLALLLGVIAGLAGLAK